MNAEDKLKVIEMYKKMVLNEVGSGGICEKCGTEVPHRSMMINTNNVSYVFNAQVGVAGHPALPYLQCPISDNGEHWACSPECWLEVAVDCLTNHQFPILKAFDTELKNPQNKETN